MGTAQSFFTRGPLPHFFVFKIDDDVDVQIFVGFRNLKGNKPAMIGFLGRYQIHKLTKDQKEQEMLIMNHF